MYEDALKVVRLSTDGACQPSLHTNAGSLGIHRGPLLVDDLGTKYKSYINAKQSDREKRNKMPLVLAARHWRSTQDDLQ